MTFRHPGFVAVLAVLCFGSESTVLAQPIAPPPKPTFSAYAGFFRPGYGYYGYGGGGPDYGAGGFGYGGAGYGFAGGGLQQNFMMQQLAVTNQNLMNLQTYMASGVNRNFPITGRGAVYNNLGHWYPMSRSSGGGFGSTGGIMAPRSSGSGSSSMGGAPGAGGGASTAGSGIPLGNSGRR